MFKKTFEIVITTKDGSKKEIYWSHKNHFMSMYKFIDNEINNTEDGWVITKIRRIN